MRANYSASVSPQSVAGSTAGAFSLSNMHYDKNGNILSLTREGLQSIDPASKQKTFGVVDQLTYRYALPGGEKSNQLLGVLDAQTNRSYAAGDFKDLENATQPQEYAYDPAGNLLRDDNKGLGSIRYNHLNLPVEVSFGADRYIRYVYDGAGVKRRKIVKDGTGSMEVATDYLAGGVFEQNQLQFLATGEGRALPPEQTAEAFFAYEYHYKDHLGNLRVSFRKAPVIDPFRATMELASAPLEEAQFDNVARTRSSTHALNGSVGEGKHSARVGTLADGTRQVLGPWRTLSVKQGDRVQAQVYAYYPSTSESNGTRVELTTFVSGQTTAPATGEQTNNLWDRLRLGLSFPLAGRASEQDNTLPIAYLKYIFFDKNYQPVRDLIVPVTALAGATNGGWEALSFELTASEEGYVQVLVANESQKPVWFDDLEIKHTPALIVQENHYDPWGLNLAGIEKQGQPDHKFQYNGKEKQEELGLNWADYGARMYDPQLGRWHVVDPITEGQDSWTPYHYVYNNPVLRTDPDGRCPDGDCPGITVAGMIENTVKDLAVSVANVFFMGVEGSNQLKVYQQGGNERAYRDENGTIQIGIRPLPASGEELLRNVGSDVLDGVNVGTTLATGGAGSGGLLMAKTVGKAAITNEVVQEAKQTLRLRHYTSRSGSKGIEADMELKASDQNKVFAEKASKRPLSQADAEQKYGIKQGKGRDYVEFDVDANKVEEVYNPITKIIEQTIRGNVKLNPETTTIVKRR